MMLIKYVLYFLKKNKKNLIAFACLSLISIFSMFISITAPILQRNFLDALIKMETWNNIKIEFLLIVIISGLSIIVGFVNSFISASLTEQLEYDMVSQMVQHIQRVPILEVRAYNSAYLNQRINEDSSNIIGFFLTHFYQFPCNWIIGLLQIIIMYKIKPVFSWITLGYIPIYLFSYKITKDKIYFKNLSLSEKQNKYSSILYDQFHFIKDIKFGSTFDENKKRLKSAFTEYFSHYIDVTRFSLYIYTFNNVISTIFNLIFLAVSADNYINHQISIGDITLLSTYFNMITASVLYYADFGKSYQIAKVSIDRMIELEDLAEENNGKIRIKNIDHISVRNLCYKYPGSSKELISDLNACFKAGNAYLLTGGNGTGKTTILTILVGLIQKGWKGHIEYNNYPLEDLDLYWLRKNNMFILSQGDSEQNIIVDEYLQMHLNYCDENEFMNIIKDTNSKINFGSKFQIKNFLNKNMLSISGGEAKKVRLLVSYLKDADVVILDEPTNELDKESVNYFLENIHKMKKDRIILIISHDPKVKNYVDEVIRI